MKVKSQHELSIGLQNNKISYQFRLFELKVISKNNMTDIFVLLKDFQHQFFEEPHFVLIGAIRPLRTLDRLVCLFNVNNAKTLS